MTQDKFDINIYTHPNQIPGYASDRSLRVRQGLVADTAAVVRFNRTEARVIALTAGLQPDDDEDESNCSREETQAAAAPRAVDDGGSESAVAAQQHDVIESRTTARQVYRRSCTAALHSSIHIPMIGYVSVA